jgi:protein involved in polysaccharide export with SLBB domain
MPPDRRLVFLSADLSAALRMPGSKADLALAARDRIIVFDANASRKQLIDPLLAELRRQSDLATPTAVVTVGGRVKAPGDYPLEPGMRVSDLLRAAGRLEDAAFPTTAELTRYRSDGKERMTELLEIDLASVLRGDTSADVLLQSFDTLTIKELPEWSLREQVTLKGEVRFPGVYPIRRGETLRSVLERAGGVTSLAFVQGAVFTRRDLLEREQKQIDELSARLKSDLATTAVSLSQSSQSGAQSAQALSSAQGLLGQLQTTKPVGRLVVDLQRVLSGGIGSEGDVALRDGDALVVPGARQEVTVLGEVQNSTSHLYRKGLDRDEYIRLSGGLTRKADDSRIYVVRADGSVVANTGGGWFRRGSRVTIQPGDTIVAPIDTDRLPTLPLWQTVTTIVYNVAIAAKAVGLL